MSRPVRYEERAGLGSIVLDDPPGNPLALAAFDALADAVERALSRPLDGLIVHGAGRHFSSGAVVAELRRLFDDGDEAARERIARNTDVFARLEQAPFPVVAAIGGSCLGAGLELALACHFRVATERSVLGLPESTFDLMPGCGGTVRLPELVGPARAAEMILTGAPVLGRDAHRLGLVDLIARNRDLVSAAAAAARRLAGARAVR